MGNALLQKRKQKVAIAAVCVFALAVGLTAPPAQGAVLLSDTILYGDAAIFVFNQYQWMASSGNLTNIPPLSPGQDVRYGSAGDSMVSGKGKAIYQSTKQVDDQSILTYQSTIHQQADSAAYSQSAGIGTDANNLGPTMCSSANVVAQQTSDNPMLPSSDSATQEVIGTGTNLSYTSSAVTSQADTDTPDRLDFRLSSSGSNGVTLTDFKGWSQSGLDQNSSELNFDHFDHQHEGSAGNFSYGIQMNRTWLSFADVFGAAS